TLDFTQQVKAFARWRNTKPLIEFPVKNAVLLAGTITLSQLQVQANNGTMDVLALWTFLDCLRVEFNRRFLFAAFLKNPRHPDASLAVQQYELIPSPLCPCRFGAIEIVTFIEVERLPKQNFHLVCI